MTAMNLPGHPDLSPIDEIPWGELNHAYGAAIDVPGQLRSVLDPDPEKRRITFFSFTCNLFHQGSVYSATVPAIAVLQQLLRYKDVPDKSKILETLLAFAVGFPEDIDRNLNLAEFLGAGDDDDFAPGDDPSARECYLAVGAGAPLYEALLRDSDPRTVIAAAYVLAFFPAHAFSACPELLKIAQSEDQHDFVRSSALNACSYLGGGGVHSSYLHALEHLIEGETVSTSTRLRLLPAIAVYALLRESDQVISPALRTQAIALADHCLEHDVVLPPCDFYTLREPANPNDANFDARDLLMPDPQFPWGSLVARLQKLTGKKSMAIEKRRQKADRAQQESSTPRPDQFEVKPDCFALHNVQAAVRRYHAYFIGDRQQIVQATAAFAPFRPHAVQAWSVILELLDSEDIQVRWAAAAMLEFLDPLDEVKVGQLIERLHANNNRSLCSALRKQKLTAQQCQELCDRLSNGDFVREKHVTNRDDYQSLVLEQGTDQQLWQLYEHGEDTERSMAISAIVRRGLIDESDPRVHEAAAADLLSGNFGRVMSAKYAFAKSFDAQKWFFANINTLSKPQYWAVLDAMKACGPDLLPLQDRLFEQIKAETNPVLQSKLIDLLGGIVDVTPALVDQLLSVSSQDPTSLQRAAQVRVLGIWLTSTDAKEYVLPKLLLFLGDDSARIRRIALEQLAGDSSRECTAEFRKALKDPAPENVRFAMWHLACKNALVDEDFTLLLSSDQPDRLSAEALLATAIHPQALATSFDSEICAPNGPLTKSILLWRQSERR